MFLTSQEGLSAHFRYIAFDLDPMSAETRDVLLHGELQDGIWNDLINKAPAISGVHSYQELCIAERNEERWLSELKRKRHYVRGDGSQNQANKADQLHQPPQPRKNVQRGKPTSINKLNATFVIALIILLVTAGLLKLKAKKNSSTMGWN